MCVRAADTHTVQYTTSYLICDSYIAQWSFPAQVFAVCSHLRRDMSQILTASASTSKLQFKHWDMKTKSTDVVTGGVHERNGDPCWNRPY